MTTDKMPLWLVKVVKYEYWPWWFFYIPLTPVWLWFSLRARSFTYVTAANPGIEMGGLFGESKKSILSKIDPRYLPQNIFIEKNTSFESIPVLLSKNNFSYPFICKPDVGERGFHVAKIIREDDLKLYFEQNMGRPFIIQEYIDYPLELGILYYRFPKSAHGKVSSVTMKKFLSVTGNGRSTISELIKTGDVRVRLQQKRLEKEMPERMSEIPQKGEEVVLEVIGNHCKGTEFINGNHLINEQLHRVFDAIALPLEGIYYGRFDLRVKSLEDLYRGENIRIMELNGISSEPGHIYDKNHNLFKAYRDTAFHWDKVSKISRQNRRVGFRPTPVRVVMKTLYRHFRSKS